jgi:hypothetical protein
MQLSAESKKRMASIMREKFRRVCTNQELVDSLSDDELIAQAERHHRETEARHRARSLSLAFKSAVASTPPNKRTAWR